MSPIIAINGSREPNTRNPVPSARTQVQWMDTPPTFEDVHVYATARDLPPYHAVIPIFLADADLRNIVYETPCPGSPELTAWSAWSACSATCGDGDRSRSRTCIFGCSNIDDNDSNHRLTESEVCNQAVCPQRCGTLTWAGPIPVRENQFLTQGLQMNRTFRFRFEVFLRSTGSTLWRSIFFANDGSTITSPFAHQCGQRLATVYMAPEAYYRQRSGLIIHSDFY